MCKNWAVTFYNKETKKVKVDMFTDANEAQARRSFRECYRHGDYVILSVVEVPEM